MMKNKKFYKMKIKDLLKRIKNQNKNSLIFNKSIKFKVIHETH